MKNIIVAITVLLSFTTFSYSQNNETLTGKIKEKKSYSLEQKFGEFTKRLNHKYVCDDNGRLIEDTYYNENGIERQDKVKYDENGNIIERYEKISIGLYIKKYNDKGNVEESFFYNNSGDLEDRYTFIYDQEGMLVEVSEYGTNERLRSKRILKYDSIGNEIESSRYDSNGQIKSKHNYKYDNDGNRIEVCQYISYKDEFTKYTYRYDRGKIVEEYCYDSNGNVISKEIFKYDKNGNEIVNCKYDSNGRMLEKSTHNYDKKGKETKSCLYGPDKKLLHKTTTTYDKDGNEIESRNYDSSGSMYLKYTYTYENGKMTYECVTRYNSDGNTDFKEYYIFNSKGEKIEEHYDKPQENLYLKTIYKYNENGDLIEWNKFKGKAEIFDSGEITEYVYFQ